MRPRTDDIFTNCVALREILVGLARVAALTFALAFTIYPSFSLALGIFLSNTVILFWALLFSQLHG